MGQRLHASQSLRYLQNDLVAQDQLWGMLIIRFQQYSSWCQFNYDIRHIVCVHIGRPSMCHCHMIAYIQPLQVLMPLYIVAVNNRFTISNPSIRVTFVVLAYKLMMPLTLSKPFYDRFSCTLAKRSKNPSTVDGTDSATAVGSRSFSEILVVSSRSIFVHFLLALHWTFPMVSSRKRYDQTEH